MNKEIFFTPSLVSSEEREKLYRQKGCVVWLTGLSGSGKSTIAKELERKLFNSGRLVYILDGDNVRHGLNSDLGFSDKDRTENIRRTGEMAGLFADAGIITITAFISPFKKDRKHAREAVKSGRFYEVYLNAPLRICEKRDPKGLYKKARQEKIVSFTGIDSVYEAPKNPDLEINTGKLSPAESVNKIIKFLREKEIFVESCA